MNKTILYKRNEAIRYVIENVEKLYGISYDDFLYIDLDKNSENYKRDIEIVKKIINSDNEHFKMFLWNEFELYRYSPTEDGKRGMLETDSKDISKFLIDQMIAYQRSKQDMFNINQEITSDRLTTYNNPDDYQEIFYNHYKTDPLFSMFASAPNTSGAYYTYVPRMMPFLFILLDKNNSNPVGYVQLYNYDSDTKSAELTYYIFEEYRGKGFASEAIKALIDAAFNNKLECYLETPYKYKYEKGKAPIELIYANTNVNNINSIKLLEKLGFKKTGIISRANYIKDNEYTIDTRFELYKKQNKVYII